MSDDILVDDTVQKYFCPNRSATGGFVVIRGYRHSESLAMYMFYFKLALEDFPMLKVKDVDVKKYNNGTGIEFSWKDAPDEYARIPFLDNTR